MQFTIKKKRPLLLQYLKPKDFLVGDEYRDFPGGKNTFTDLLQTFDEVGKEFKDRLDKKFKEIAAKKLDSY